MSDDDTYEIPLQDQRVFGAGIKRKRVQFVPSSTPAAPAASSTTPAKSIGDLYLNLVLPKDSKEPGTEKASQDEAPQSMPKISTDSEGPSIGEQPVCEICKLPFSETGGGEDDISSKARPHEASLAHQVCLTHSHPPSHLDRNRKGLVYLSSYGWDPDARMGLGAQGQGMQFPIKTKAKDDKLGIGVILPKPGEIKKKVKLEKLDAGQIKKLHEKERKKTERLREMFYQNEDVERYLGGG